jgi:hypothetical protein
LVDSLSQGRTQIEAFGLYYLYAAAIGVPAIALCIWLAMIHPKTATAASA